MSDRVCPQKRLARIPDATVSCDASGAVGEGEGKLRLPAQLMVSCGLLEA